MLQEQVYQLILKDTVLQGILMQETKYSNPSIRRWAKEKNPKLTEVRFLRILQNYLTYNPLIKEFQTPELEPETQTQINAVTEPVTV